MQTQQQMTIGELAERVGVRTSTLRYYEEQGLLQPQGRSPAGYRLYDETAESTLRLIQRAQRIGLSLADIRPLLKGYQSGDLSDDTIIQIVEARAVGLEQQLTQLLVLQHELDLFLQDMRHEHEGAQTYGPDHSGTDHFDRLLQRICINPQRQTPRNWLQWLIEYASCQLNTRQGQAILQQLAGQHMHIWQEEDAYHVLLVTENPEIGLALQTLAQLESDCDAPTHADLVPELKQDDEGFHFVVRGNNAFIYARLFLSLEQSGLDLQPDLKV